MKIDYGGLERRLASMKAMQRKWGESQARQIARRILEFEAAPCLGDLSSLPPTRCHPLTGNRQGQYAVNLQGAMRLVFEPAGDYSYHPDGSLDQTSVTEIRIMKVENYHGD